MSPSRLVASLLGLAAVAVALACPSVAHATPNFPRAIQARLGAVSAPDCSICHVGRTGRGTVVSPFGSAMRGNGLMAYDEGSLGRALQTLEADRVDSDGDGILDVDALRAGKDPNPAGTGDTGIEPETPEFGCVGRVSRTGDVPLLGASALVVCGAILGARRRSRRRVDRAPEALIFVALISATGLAACAPSWSGAGLARRSDAESTAVTPRMAAVKATAFEAELRKIGLDPRALPPFEELRPVQVRRLMSTFTRSLGFACTDCHDRGDYSDHTSTRAKHLTVRMWNDMTRGYTLAGVGAVFCDSCHQGQGKFLARTDRSAISEWMSDNFTGKLEKQSDGKRVSLECETCHGEPFDPRFLAKW